MCHVAMLTTASACTMPAGITSFATNLLPIQWLMFILEVPTLRMTVAYKQALRKPITLVLQQFAHRKSGGSSSDRWASGTLSRALCVLSDRILWSEDPEEEGEYFSPTI